MLNHVQFFCDPVDCSLPGSSVHGILQAKILEWVAFSRGSSHPGFKAMSSVLVDRFFITEPPGKPIRVSYNQFVFSGRKKSMWVPETGMG